MEFDLPVNESRTKTFTVQEHQIADFLGSGKVSVLSSPSMILMMEQTAMLFAQEYLSEEYITVGTRVDVSHLRASKLGAEITVNAKLIDFEKKHMVFVVEAFDGEHKIGEGKHERHIVNKEKFISRIQKNKRKEVVITTFVLFFLFYSVGCITSIKSIITDMPTGIKT